MERKRMDREVQIKAILEIIEEECTVCIGNSYNKNELQPSRPFKICMVMDDQCINTEILKVLELERTHITDKVIEKLGYQVMERKEKRKRVKSRV